MAQLLPHRGFHPRIWIWNDTHTSLSTASGDPPPPHRLAPYSLTLPWLKGGRVLKKEEKGCRLPSFWRKGRNERHHKWGPRTTALLACKLQLSLRDLRLLPRVMVSCMWTLSKEMKKKGERVCWGRVHGKWGVPRTGSTVAVSHANQPATTHYVLNIHFHECNKQILHKYKKQRITQ